MNDDTIWIAFMLRDKYANDLQKNNLKKDIMLKFNRKKEDICYTSCGNDFGSIYYFFVKEYDKENDLRNIHQAYTSHFQSYYYHTRIKEKQLNDLFSSIKKSNEVVAKFGDLVLINKGEYSKLYGIILRQNRNKKIDVGFKFGFGSVIKSYDISDFTIVGNIFNYIKVLY